MTPEDLSLAVRGVLADAVAAGELAVAVPDTVTVERPRNRDHGDWSTNVALQLAKGAGVPPRQVAKVLAARLAEVPGVKSVDVAGPGFLNVVVDAASAGELARTIVLAGAAYGNNKTLAGHVVNLEFVSANPTGPLHIGHTRWAALGDALGRVLSAAGADVTREFYINDHGAQMDKFGASVLARLRGEDVPEDGYHGEYVVELAEKVRAELVAQGRSVDQAPLDEVRELAYQAQLTELKEVLAEFGVHFDVWFSERTLHATGAVEKAVARLREQGHVVDRDGAVWLRTTDFGDDRDRVLLRSDGSTTYFAADAAYYLSKRDRGFAEKVYMLGADHHGYVARLKAIAACAGDDPERSIEVLIGQLVTVAGARLSKRAGNIIELRDLVHWLGRDAVRYSLARFPADSPITLEPDLLTKRSNDNPVFYVQYAHARTSNVTRLAIEDGVRTEDGFDPSLLDHETESVLLATLGQFPGVVATAAELREPHRVARFLEILAGAYHKWYDLCRVRPQNADEEVTDLHRTRLWLNEATRTVLARGLDLLGVSAPERM
ncbi:MAG TPA: arginine--tRNA ligase [Actinomycetales bacterium]|nr:arginine--tRNA ligase [Actinomycetales bacterium]